MLLVMLPAASAAAQSGAQVVTPPVSTNGTTWDSAASYITAGQDEPGYRSWFIALPLRAVQVKAFNDYLETYGAGGILPTWQLLRTATSWKDCASQPFEVPPPAEWPHIVQTLRYIRDYVVPAVGPVEAVSGYRNPVLNVCAGGAPESAHKHFSALDLVPLQPTTREAMMRALCKAHARRGGDYGVGLGFYAFLRFHVDTTKFRRWNMDPAVAQQCPPIVHPSDVASVGQPLPQSAASAPPDTVTTPAAAPGTVSAMQTPETVPVAQPQSQPSPSEPAGKP
jgi:hypothetical protein